MASPQDALVTRQSLGLRVVRHAAILAGYAVLGIAVSWPLARDFSRYLTGDIYFDQWHAIWHLGYQRDAFIGRTSWPYTTLLYFPHGISTLVDGVGPVNGLLALPFWPWGPVAAFNGAVLVGLTLSAWCAYLLARYLGLGRPAALFSGLVFTVWPLHLAALYGHLEKVFVGLLPLTLLAGLMAFDVRRRWTIAAPGVALLALLFQNGNQFTFGVLGLVVLGIFQLARTPRDRWAAQLRRVVLTGVVSIGVCAPALYLILRTTTHPLLVVKLGDFAAFFSPDLLQFVLPSVHQALAGHFFYTEPLFNSATHARSSIFPSLSASVSWIGNGVETAVTIPLTVLFLSIAACFSPRRIEARWWLVFGVVFAVLAAGPQLRVAGRTYFGPDMTIVALPYFWLQRLPGFDVMRTPGRFMMIASVGFAIVAGLGFEALLRRNRRAALAGASVIVLLVLAECWPSPWAQRPLPPVPEFYRQIASDREPYAVLDLPAAWEDRANLNAGYTYYQAVHGHPIAWAYLSRTYVQYPVDGLDALWDPAYTDYEATRRRLVQLGYRYVVWHKYPALLLDTGRLGEPRAGFAYVVRGPIDSSPFYRELFAGRTPFYDDALVAVHCLGTEDRRSQPARCR